MDDLRLSQEQEEIFKKNEKLIFFVVNKYFKFREMDNIQITYQDKIQIASIGLIKAIKNFDSSYGFQFSTYAIRMIHGELHRAYRDTSRDLKIPRRVYLIYRSICKNNQKSITIPEIMNEYKIDEHLAQAVHEYLNISFISKDLTFNNNGFRNDLLIENTLPNNNGEIDDLLNKMELEDRLSVLPQKNREIIELALQGLTQATIGKIVGLSQVHVSRMIKKSIEIIEEKFEKVTI